MTEATKEKIRKVLTIMDGNNFNSSLSAESAVSNKKDVICGINPAN